MGAGGAKPVDHRTIPPCKLMMAVWSRSILELSLGHILHISFFFANTILTVWNVRPIDR